MLKVLLFLLFLIAYGIWSWATFKSSKKMQADLLAGKSFWSGERVLLLSLTGLFGFIYLLSGLWSLKLILLILIASHLGALVAWLLNLTFGAHSERARIRAFWAGGEIGLKNPIVMGALGGLTAVASLSYPIVAGVIFFRHPWATPVLQILVVKYSVLLLSLSGYVLMMTAVCLLLASENLDEDTRQLIFINQLGGMISLAVFVALALRIFEIGGTPHTYDFMGVSHTFSLQTLLLLLLFFTATVLVPYLIGTQRARRVSLGMREEVRECVAELADILEAPTGHLYVARLAVLRDKIASTVNKFTSDDVLLTKERNFRQNPEQTEAVVKPMMEALEKTRDLDPRFKFLDGLGRVEKDIEEVVADLQSRTKETIEQAAEQWSKRFEIRKAELVKEIEAARSRKPLVTVLFGGLLSTIVSGALTEVAHAAGQWITHAPK
jgi:hypothetical protein